MLINRRGHRNAAYLAKANSLRQLCSTLLTEIIHTDLEETGINKFRWLPGAIGLVEFGGIPAVVPTNLINRLQQLMDEKQVAKAE